MDTGIVTLPRWADPTAQPYDETTSSPVIVEGCFGWLHRPSLQPGAVGRDTAVLICPPLGWDAMHAHHGLRGLADQLAAAGYHAMRLHYPGTGNSADAPPREDGAVDYWQTWQDGVNAAADWLVEVSGATNILLVGLRFGALIAGAVAATRRDVSGLLLLAPVLRGKSYLRQLDMEARLETGTDADPTGGIEFHELRFAPDVVEQMSAVDLRRVALPAACKVAVFAQASAQVLDTCLGNWAAAGLDVHAADFTGLDPLLQETIYSDPPPPDLTPLLGWILQTAPGSATKQADPAPLALWRKLHLPACTERAVAFGDANRLFGILCRPRVEAAGAPLVIIANTGRDPHYGIARFGTEFARSLAAAGIPSFRIDFAGLGDSRVGADEPDRLSPVFERDRSGDLSAAIDAMQHQGFRHFAVEGLCAGAYHAFWAAGRDSRIAALLLVNMPLFAWQGGDSVRAAMWKSAPASRLMLRLRDAAAWGRVLRGQSEVRAIVRVLGQRIVARLNRSHTAVSPGHVEVAHDLAQRGVRSLFLYGPGDPGLDALVASFGPEGETLRSLPGVDLRLVSGIDHVLSGREMRATATREMLDFLRTVIPQGQSTPHEHPFDDSGSDGDRRPAAETASRAAA